MKTLIVDDEARVRKAIRLLVDWEAHQMDEIVEAASGSEAIQLICEDKPAIVIMDIMMDDGNGLELMKWVNEYAGSIKFIVVSGHNDFEFVRHAVQHGGIDYILKPIEAEVINAAMAKAAAAWRAEEQERAARQLQSIRLNEFKPVYGEKLLSALIDDPLNAEASYRRLCDEGVVPRQVNATRLILLQLDLGHGPLLTRFGGDSELLRFAMINICNDFLSLPKRGLAFRYWGAASEIAILFWDQHTAISSWIDNLNQGMFRTLQCRVHFGISSLGAFPKQASRQYAEAAGALSRRNLLDQETYAHFAAHEDQHIHSIAEHRMEFADVQEEWKIAVLSGKPELMEAAAQRWIDAWNRGGVVTPEMLRAWRADCLSFRAKMARDHLGEGFEAVLGELEQADHTSPVPSASGYSFSMYSWRDWGTRLMQQLSRELLARRVQERTIINNIVKYIEQHYSSELSLQEVAGKFFVSREYISRKFKQELGINFSEYLAEFRIQRSKLLMQNPRLSISQISEMVGFQDVKYFSKVFKKIEGVSPKGYRSKLDLL
ncbi:DNA-binding response regulator [Paenibacillus sp. CAA11]|uniref:response regulator n=1 Tax=Paenibacillus sp. CAA11 TaxID=1532905 RepID=UPI000D37BADD|nr:response regulator [Paenibacillus sp. CAA11]AWB46046.1 DNA-binding response regulator [Paenibacillus sp. CAA11]